MVPSGDASFSEECPLVWDPLWGYLALRIFNARPRWPWGRWVPILGGVQHEDEAVWGFLGPEIPLLRYRWEFHRAGPPLAWRPCFKATLSLALIGEWLLLSREFWERSTLTRPRPAFWEGLLEGLLPPKGPKCREIWRAPSCPLFAMGYWITWALCSSRGRR